MTDLLELHKRTNNRYLSYDERQQLREQYRQQVNLLCDKLPFSWELLDLDNQGGNCHGSMHIVVNEDIKQGKLSRSKGDALCKKVEKFNGNLCVFHWEKACLDCKTCLEKAIKIVDGL